MSRVKAMKKPCFAEKYGFLQKQALTFFEDGTRGAAATRKGAPSTRREYEVAGAL